MAQSDIKITIDTHFNDNWTDTPIQFQGQELDNTGMDNFISLIYNPVENETYGLDGTPTGRILFSGIYKVFIYAKNYNKALILADAIKSFLNGTQINHIHVGLGQDGAVNDIGNGFKEILTTFVVNEWSITNHSEDYLINKYGLTDEDGNFLTDEDGAYLLQEF